MFFNIIKNINSINKFMKIDSFFIGNISKMIDNSQSVIEKIFNNFLLIDFKPSLSIPSKSSIVNIKIIKNITFRSNKINISFIVSMFNCTTVKIDKSFFFYDCRSLMISNIKLIRLFTIIWLSSMSKLIR